MLQVIKKLDSATIKGLIVATIPLLVLIGSFFGVDEAIFQAKLAEWGEKFIALVSLLGVAWAAYARVFMPTPPLTNTAMERTALLVEQGKLKPSTTMEPPGVNSQGGFVRAAMLGLLLAFGAISLITVSACSNTRMALRNADTVSDYALVFLEGYDSALKTANQLRSSGVLSGENLERVRQAELKAWPPVEKIDPLRRAYDRTQSAEDAETLQRAIDDAIREAADFIRIVRDLRGGVTGDLF